MSDSSFIAVCVQCANQISLCRWLWIISFVNTCRPTLVVSTHCQCHCLIPSICCVRHSVSTWGFKYNRYRKRRRMIGASLFSLTSYFVYAISLHHDIHAASMRPNCEWHSCFLRALQTLDFVVQVKYDHQLKMWSRCAPPTALSVARFHTHRDASTKRFSILRTTRHGR